jgi:hypothetical protein
MTTASQQSYRDSPSVNWGALLEQIQTDYESPPAKGVAHGLQKEAIQNGWGARSAKSGGGWSFEFRLLTDAGGTRLLTMTDRGTIGLIGDPDFDWSLLKGSEGIPDEQRLARFESAYESGGDNESPGLFGRGKLIFNVASKRSLIYYDTLIHGGEYRLGERQVEGRTYRQYRRVLTGSDAQAKLQQIGGGNLLPLTDVGTRITIVDPLDEVVEAISNGDFLRAIEETWWEIVLKHDVAITVAIGSQPQVTASVPPDFGGLPQKAKDGWKVFYKENVPLEADGSEYRIKRIHLLVPPDGWEVRPDLLGVVLRRRGMAIGPVRMSGIPSDLKPRLFGYIELDSGLEAALVRARQENTTHYGFAFMARPPFRQIRQSVQLYFEEFLTRLGYKKPGDSPEERVKRLADDAKAELNTILNSLGMPGFGSGSATADLVLSVEDLTFPGGTNEVSHGDKVSGFKFRLANFGRKDQNLTWSVRTFERDAGQIETVAPSEKVRVKTGGSVESPVLSFTLGSVYPATGKVGCTCEVLDSDGKRVARKTFYVYVGIPKESPHELATLHLMMAEWPRKESRRVDYGHTIKNLLYQVENETSLNMNVRLRLRTLWKDEGNATIEEVTTQDVEMSAFQAVHFTVPEVKVDEATYQDVGQGRVNLRMHAVALEATPQWDKSDRLAENTVPFYLNMDPDFGFFDIIEYNQEGKAAPRSHARSADGGKTWTLSINLTHPAYRHTEDDEDRRGDYLFEEMARQTVYVLVSTGQGVALAKQADLTKDEDVFTMDPDEVLKRVQYVITDRILAAYYGG